MIIYIINIDEMKIEEINYGDIADLNMFEYELNDRYDNNWSYDKIDMIELLKTLKQ